MDNKHFELALATFKDVVETHLKDHNPDPERIINFIKEMNEVIKSYQVQPSSLT